ncbi:putative methyltransferase protein [Rhizobium phage RHph_I1_18]|nr:putative methyltransferase protein [Rhizobium phage RHph_I1_18]
MKYKLMEEVDGLGPWIWPIADTGAWDGPVDDWKTSHKIVMERIRDRRVIIQAGGNLGLYPALLSQLFKVVYTVEPHKGNFDCLMRNVSHIDNVIPLHAAVGAERKKVGTSQAVAQNVGMTYIDEAGSDVDMWMIDELHQWDDQIDVIWLDIEGYELNALKGATETIKKSLPVIGVERPSTEVEALLDSLGYLRFGDSKMDVFFYHPEGNQII